MKIAFVWYWDRASKFLSNWRDGLRAALEIIEKENEVVWFLDEKIPDPSENWDAVLFWGDATCPFFDSIIDYRGKKGIFLSTHPNSLEGLANLGKLDVIYCESQPVLEGIISEGLPGILAFGTDTNFFVPDDNVIQDIEYFYPATFSPWKRQNLIASLGKKLLCIGTVQSDGEDILKECQNKGVQTITGYLPAEEIRDYYRRAKRVPIPATHGSERTCLEAMSMNILPRVFTHNLKTFSYVLEYLQTPYLHPRNFVEDNYSAKIYAQNIMKGLNE